jgi:5-methylcytosine-specific restriction endonuclease McrA
MSDASWDSRDTSDSVKRNVRVRDSARCVLCHAPGTRRMLQVAHIVHHSTFKSEVSIRARRSPPLMVRATDGIQLEVKQLGAAVHSSRRQRNEYGDLSRLPAKSRIA